MNNIHNTKNKLSLFFVGVVFVLIFIFALSGSITKYISGYQKEKQGFLTATSRIETFVTKSPQLLQARNIFSQKIEQKGKKLHKNNLSGIIRGMNPVEVIVIEDSQITSSNIFSDISETTLNAIFHKRSTSLQEIDGYLTIKIQRNNREYIFFQKLRYSLTDVRDDTLLILLFGSLFSLFIYLIGTKFIHKVFEPVEANLDDMKQFVHNAGHELKTPIAVMDSNIQLLLEMQSFDREMTLEMKSELKKMNSLIDSLIKLSDIGELHDIESNNLGEIIDEIIKNYSEKIQEKNLTVQTKIASETCVESNRDYLFIFLSNLIGNAIKYNTKNGNIDISYHKRTLSIKDSGIGMTNKDTKKIFDRFFQVDASRQSDGFGIGLSLVKRIADVYNWTIEVKSEEGKGSEFVVRF